jgi:hypothetical protein
MLPGINPHGQAGELIMSEQTGIPMGPFEPPPMQAGPPTIPPAVWAEIQAETRELKAQNFKNREELLAWLEARGYEDGEKILQRLQSGGEI